MNYTIEQLQEYQKLMALSSKINDVAEEVSEILSNLTTEFETQVPEFMYEFGLEESSKEELAEYLDYSEPDGDE